MEKPTTGDSKHFSTTKTRSLLLSRPGKPAGFSTFKSTPSLQPFEPMSPGAWLWLSSSPRLSTTPSCYIFRQQPECNPHHARAHRREATLFCVNLSMSSHLSLSPGLTMTQDWKLSRVPEQNRSQLSYYSWAQALGGKRTWTSWEQDQSCKERLLSLSYKVQISATWASHGH